jgi:hypothetical protein
MEIYEKDLYTMNELFAKFRELIGGSYDKDRN